MASGARGDQDGGGVEDVLQRLRDNGREFVEAARARVDDLDDDVKELGEQFATRARDLFDNAVSLISTLPDIVDRLAARGRGGGEQEAKPGPEGDDGGGGTEGEAKPKKAQKAQKAKAKKAAPKEGPEQDPQPPKDVQGEDEAPEEQSPPAGGSDTPGPAEGPYRPSAKGEKATRAAGKSQKSTKKAGTRAGKSESSK